MASLKLIMQNSKVILKTMANYVLNITGIKDLYTGDSTVASNKINWTLQHYTKTASYFTTNNPILLEGQLGVESDDLTTTPKFKIGDGITDWNTLPYVSSGGGGGSQDLQQVTDIGNSTTNNILANGFIGALKKEVKLSENITKGQAVYISSANGTNIIVSKASNATEATSSKTLGLLETTGVTNDILYVITEGMLGGLNTSTATIGDAVWLGNSGNLIFGLASKPVAPAHLVYIGVVSRVHAVNGEILVKVQNGFELNEIHDVLTSANVTTPVDLDSFLFKENSSGLWKSLSWSNLKVTLKTYFDTLYGTIKGSVITNAGAIPFATGVADTVTSSSNFSYISDNVQVTGNVNGAVTMTTRNNSTGNGAGTGFNAVNNAGKIAQFFKAGTGYSTYKTIKANDCGFYTDNGDFSVLNDGVGGAIQFTAGNASIAHLIVKSTGDIGHAKNSFFGDTTTTATACVDIKGGTSLLASFRLRQGVPTTTPLNGEMYQDGTDCYMYLAGTWKKLNV